VEFLSAKLLTIGSGVPNLLRYISQDMGCRNADTSSLEDTIYYDSEEVLALLYKLTFSVARKLNKMSTDPFYPVLVDCMYAAQGLIHAGNGALMTMLPEKTTLPGAPALNAAPDVVRAFGYDRFRESAFQLT
jgi:hypothetical protein